MAGPRSERLGRRELDGVSVSIDGQPAYVYFISPTQINALAPDYLAESVSVQVDTPGGKSNTVAVQKSQFSPALFLFSQGRGKYAAAVHADGAYVAPAGLIPGAPSRPASPGETILLFGTGFGATNPTSPPAEVVSSASRIGCAHNHPHRRRRRGVKFRRYRFSRVELIAIRDGRHGDT